MYSRVRTHTHRHRSRGNKENSDGVTVNHAVKQSFLKSFVFYSQEVHDEVNAPPEPTDYRSVTQRDFNIVGFEPSEPQPTAVSTRTKDQPEILVFVTVYCLKIWGKMCYLCCFQHHDYTSEQPVSFWTEHKEKITVSIWIFIIVHKLQVMR